MARKQITDTFAFEQDIVFEGAVEKVIAEIRAVEESIYAKYPEARDEAVIIESSYYGHDGGREYHMSFTRFETDAEMKAREKKEAAYKAKKLKAAEAKKAKAMAVLAASEATERALYEELKKKFGD